MEKIPNQEVLDRYLTKEEQDKMQALIYSICEKDAYDECNELLNMVMSSFTRRAKLLGAI